MYSFLGVQVNSDREESKLKTDWRCLLEDQAGLIPRHGRLRVGENFRQLQITANSGHIRGQPILSVGNEQTCFGGLFHQLLQQRDGFLVQRGEFCENMTENQNSINQSIN